MSSERIISDTVGDKALSDGSDVMKASAGDVPDKVRVKNRRKRYLDTNPSYFGPQLELAGRQ